MTKTFIVTVLVLDAVVAAVMADGEYAPPAYEKKYDGYFQYANVPGDNEYEFGYNRGNPSHYTSRYEQSKDSRFRTTVFQYANVPGDSEYEFGYNRGNPSHYTSRYEQSKNSRFRTKVKWADIYNGYGENYWEFNHGDNYVPAYPAPVYAAPAYSYPFATYEQVPGKF